MILGIYGSGGLGKEMAQVAMESNLNHRWNSIIFIDDFNKQTTVNGFGVVSYEKYRRIAQREHAEMVIAVGEPAARSSLLEKVLSDELRLGRIVHPLADLPESSKLCAGSVMFRDARVSPNVEIGCNVLLNSTVNVGHDCQIGDNSVISTFVAIGGGTKIGNRVFVGMGATLRDGISVGDDSIVSMGSQVFKDVPEGVTVMGNPARAIRNSKDGVFHHRYDSEN